MRALETQKVTVIEDDETVREFMEIYLELSDYQVSARQGLAEDINFSDEFLSSDLFIIDKNLPLGSGIDLSANILNHAPTSKILIISGDFSKGNKSEMEKMGISYLEKPFTADELILSLDKVRFKSA